MSNLFGIGVAQALASLPGAAAAAGAGSLIPQLAPFQTASGFSIVELGGQERHVLLQNRGLPYRPFNLKTKQRVELTWLPGNPEATGTVLGASEDPTQINGYWKDKFIGDTGTYGVAIQSNNVPIVTVRDAYDLFSSLCREGQLLEIQWDQQVRRGFLTEFDANWHNVHDLEWAMRLEWINRGETTVPVVQQTSSGLDALLSIMNKQAQQLAADVTDAGFPMPTSVLDAFVAASQTVSSLSSELLSTGGNLVDQALSPLEAVRVAIAACTNIIGAVSSMTDQILLAPALALNITWGTDLGFGFGLQGYSTLIGNANLANIGLFTSLPAYFQQTFGFSNGTDIPSQTVAPSDPVNTDYSLNINSQSFDDRMDAVQYAQALLRDCTAVKRTASEYRAIILEKLHAQLVAVYTAKSGQDLRDVSQIFYGNPWQWRDLFLYNELATPQLVAGQIVLVPQVTNAQTSAQQGG